MLPDLTPLMTDTVRHYRDPRRDIFGKKPEAAPTETYSPAGGTSYSLAEPDFTEHQARVVYSPGSIAGPASREKMPDAAATVWLADHPRPIRIGDLFGLPDGSVLKAIRAELRTNAAGCFHKVFLT